MIMLNTLVKLSLDIAPSENFKPGDLCTVIDILPADLWGTNRVILCRSLNNNGRRKFKKEEMVPAFNSIYKGVKHAQP